MLRVSPPVGLHLEGENLEELGIAQNPTVLMTIS